MKTRNYLAILAVAAGLGFASTASSAQSCERCEFDQGRFGCILGCPVEEPDCDRYEVCIYENDWCAYEDPCGSGGTLSGVTTGQGVTVAGAAVLGEKMSVEELVSTHAAFESADGIVYRRACDAIIVKRDYTDSALDRMGAEIISLTI